MAFLTDLLNKLFGLGGKAQLIILVLSHTSAVIFGLILGMAFAKPTIIVNDKQNEEQINNDEVIWGGDKAETSSSLPRGGGDNPSGEGSEYRVELLRFMPPRSSI